MMKLVLGYSFTLDCSTGIYPKPNKSLGNLLALALIPKSCEMLVFIIHAEKLNTLYMVQIAKHTNHKILTFVQYANVVITAVLHSVGMKHRSLASASENACA